MNEEIWRPRPIPVSETSFLPEGFTELSPPNGAHESHIGRFRASVGTEDAKLVPLVMLLVSLGNTQTATAAGTWKVVTWTDTNEDTHMPYYAFGVHPKGEFIFTADGRFSVQVESDQDGAAAPAVPPHKDFADLTGSFLCFSGSYRYDPLSGALDMDIGESNAPVYVMSDVSRAVRFEGNRMILSGEAIRNGHIWSWERVLERED